MKTSGQLAPLAVTEMFAHFHPLPPPFPCGKVLAANQSNDLERVTEIGHTVHRSLLRKDN